MIQTLFWAVRLRALWLLLFFVLGFIGRGFLLGTSNLIGSWVDYLVSGKIFVFGQVALDSSSSFMTALVIFVLLGFFITWIYRIGFSDLCALMVSKIYDEVTLRTSRYPMRFFDTTAVGRIVTRFSSDYGNVFRLFGGPLAEFLSIVFDLVWMFTLLSLANWRFLPFLAASVALHLVAYRYFQPKLRENRRQLSQLRAPSLAHFAESTQGATPIRIFNKERTFTNRFLKLDLRYLNQKVRTIGWVTQFTLVLNLLAIVLYGSLAAFSWVGLKNDWLTLGDMGIAFGLVALSGNTVQMFFDWLAQFEEAIVGLERLDEYLRKPLEVGSKLPAFATFPTPEHFINREYKSKVLTPDLNHSQSEHLEVRDLWFRYSSDLPWVLKGITFSIPLKGARLGVIGRTGAGKSSLIQCLFQLYPIDKGSLQLGPYQLPISDQTTGYGLDQVRQFFSYIPQDPFIFRGTLLENLDPSPKPNRTKVNTLLERLGRREWIARLDDLIEEKGKNLSAGEKQILQLARVLLQNRPVLVMDEATSNIDPATESLVIRTLNQDLQDRLQIIVAHRLETLLSCTHILWLDQGQVKMLGTPDEVLPAFRSTHQEKGAHHE